MDVLRKWISPTRQDKTRQPRPKGLRASFIIILVMIAFTWCFIQTPDKFQHQNHNTTRRQTLTRPSKPERLPTLEVVCTHLYLHFLVLHSCTPLCFCLIL